MSEGVKNIFTHFFDKSDLVQRLKSNPDEIAPALEIALGNHQPESWRACWVLKDVLNNEDPHLKQQFNLILDVIPNRPDGHQRELLHLLEKVMPDDEQEGILFDICITIWESVKRSPSVRYTAFQFIIKTLRKYPELKNEISHLTSDEYLDTLSPGIRNGVRRMLNEIQDSASGLFVKWLI